MAETNPKDKPSLRQPKAKKKLGLSVPPALRMPHDSLIQPEAASMPSQTTMTSQTTPTSHTPVAPVKDFHKVPNSVTRHAVPAGLFAGKSKQLYDCLYSLTRGAVAPSRSVRISRPRLMKKAGIGARVTFDANVDRLVAVGLLRVERIAGEHEGNEYTVFTPDELSTPSQSSMTSQTSMTEHASNLVRLDGLETSQTRHTLTADVQRTSGESKTSFKTNTEQSDDDEAFAALLAAERELTGRNSPPERWGELAELLAAELKIAAGRTTVSSVPAFLTEHLRRRLWKKEKRQVEAEAAERTEGTAQRADSSQCPDCFGTGMYYPEGFDKGVARCRHEKLTQAESEGPSGGS